MASSSNKEAPHILLVDDDNVTRKLTEDLLLKAETPYKVTAVPSAKRALEVLDQVELQKILPEVDMIITNYDMSEMTGYDLLKRVKESSTLKHTKVVMVYADRHENEIPRWKKDGVLTCLKKPLSSYILLSTCWLFLDYKSG